MIEVQLPDGTIAEFPDTMSQGEITAVLRKQFGGGEKSLSPKPSLSLGDPMAQSMSQFMAPGVPTEIAQGAVENAPALGATAGGLIGLMAPPISPLTAGLGAAAGDMVKRALQGAQRPTEGAEAIEDIKQFVIGAASEVPGYGANWLLGKLFAPAAGKISDASRSFIEFAQKNKLPFSLNVRTGVMPKIAQGAADYTGVGRVYSDIQRQKLLEGTADVVANIANDLGLPTQRMFGETGKELSEYGGGQLAGFVRSMKDTKKMYEPFDVALAKSKPIEMQSLLETVEDLGSFETIRSAYRTGKKPTAIEKTLSAIIKNQGEAEPAQINQMLKYISNNYDRVSNKDIPMKLKDAILRDMEYVGDPVTGKTLRALKDAADGAYKDAALFFSETPLAQKFLGKEINLGRGGILYKSHPLEDSRNFKAMFESDVSQAIKIKDKIISTNPELWDASKSAYLEGVFSNAVKDGMFQPKKYLSWYEAHGRSANQLMPEHAQALKEWADISSAMSTESKKYSSDIVSKYGLGTLLGIGGMTYGIMGEDRKGILVPSAFSLLAALSVMGPGKIGFLRNYLVKEASPAGEVLGGMAKQAVKAPAINYLQGAVNNSPVNDTE